MKLSFKSIFISFLLLFCFSTLPSFAEDSTQIKKDVILSKSQLEKQGKIGKNYITAIDSFIEKNTSEPKKLSEIQQRISLALSKLGNSQKEILLKRILEYLNYKIQYTLINNTEGIVIIDINHERAGQTIIFEVEVMKITKSASGTTADTIEKGDQVEVHYTAKEETGTMIDSSRGQDPIAFTVGIGQMIPGFDAGVEGMKVGDKKTLILAPKDAYGEYDETKKLTVHKSEFSSFVAAGYKLEVGEKLPTSYGNLTILKVLEKSNSIDTSNITGNWKGYYAYDYLLGKENVNFSQYIKIDGVTITGNSKEIDTFGNNEKEHLSANINGSLDGNKLTWIKTYNGDNGVQYSINYEGYYNVLEDSIEGLWDSESDSGYFRISK